MIIVGNSYNNKLFTIAHSGFDVVPSPRLMIVTLEEKHTYKCNHSETNQISWRVNDNLLDTEIFFVGIVNDTVTYPDGAQEYTLTIGGLRQHNGTKIQCTASFDDGSPPQHTPAVTFLIQGIDYTTLLTHYDTANIYTSTVCRTIAKCY